MFQRPQLQTGEEERLPGSLQQGDWPRALRTDERSVARSCRSGRVVLQECTKGNCGRTHQTTMKGGQFRRGPNDAPTLQWTGPHPTTSTEYSLARATQFHCDSPSARPCIVSLCAACAVPVWRSGVGRRGLRGVRVLYIYISSSAKKAVKLPALCVARLLWIL